MIFVDADGTKVPALGFGTWELRGEVAARMVATAIEIGYRHIDTAQMYDNEADVGRAIAGSGIDRDLLFVTTKVWPDRFRKGDLQRSVEASLERLKMARVDLLLLHWPSMEVPLAETITALDDVQHRGLARHVGVSNFPSPMLAEAQALSSAGLVNDQVEYHPYLSQRGVLTAVRASGMTLTAYCPLARGRVEKEPLLRAIGRRHGKSPSQVTLRWLVQQDRVMAIPRTAKAEHARSNFAIWDFELDKAEMAAIHGLAEKGSRLCDNATMAPLWDAA